MRALTKLSEPAILTEEKEARTTRYAKAPSDRKPSVWKIDEVLETLKVEALSKCMYCESLIGASSYAHIEHIKARFHYPELVVDWNNLGLACQVCNTKKGKYDNAESPLLNPYQDDPAEHLRMLGPLVKGSESSPRGKKTVAKLQLSRIELVAARCRAIEKFDAVFQLWADSSGGDKEIFEDMVREELDDSIEYVETLRAYAQWKGFAPAASVTGGGDQ